MNTARLMSGVKPQMVTAVGTKTWSSGLEERLLSARCRPPKTWGKAVRQNPLSSVKLPVNITLGPTVNGDCVPFLGIMPDPLCKLLPTMTKCLG